MSIWQQRIPSFLFEVDVVGWITRTKSFGSDCSEYYCNSGVFVDVSCEMAEPLVVSGRKETEEISEGVFGVCGL